MSKSKKPAKWTDCYPQGTKEGDEEQLFFISLGRHPKWEWRSVAQMSKETGLTEKRVEELISKYHKIGLVFQSPKNETYWGYWERVPDMLPKDDDSITKKDQKHRIANAMKGSLANSKIEQQLHLFKDAMVIYASPPYESKIMMGKKAEEKVKEYLEKMGYRLIDAACEGK